ncbi:hypothetical protein CEXT_154671 [Caerostris extrusa]|uniref:Uncharacterized protein n=1 Tax=Caerostris extrusa TaxID=172846 RepID=A0AAV4SW91_CAEEX|nr:hypothetical protein CEXT_154671 [Caerostris extrusa]
MSRSMGHPIISRRHFGLLVFDVLRMSAQPLFESTAMETMCQYRAIQRLNCCNDAIYFADAVLWEDEGKSPFDDLPSSLDKRSSVWLGDAGPRKDSSAIKPIKFPADRIGSRKCFLPRMSLRFAGRVRRFSFYLPLVSVFCVRYVCFCLWNSSSCIKLPGTLFGLAYRNHCLRIFSKDVRENGVVVGYEKFANPFPSTIDTRQLILLPASQASKIPLDEFPRLTIAVLFGLAMPGPRKDSSAIKPIKFPADRIGSRKCFLPAMPLRFAGDIRRFSFFIFHWCPFSAEDMFASTRGIHPFV